MSRFKPPTHTRCALHNPNSCTYMYIPFCYIRTSCTHVWRWSTIPWPCALCLCIILCISGAQRRLCAMGTLKFPAGSGFLASGSLDSIIPRHGRSAYTYFMIISQTGTHVTHIYIDICVPSGHSSIILYVNRTAHESRTSVFGVV